MKKTLALFGLVLICVAAVVFTAVQGQNSNGQGKFRRMREDKRIPNQYIVVLKDDVAENVSDRVADDPAEDGQHRISDRGPDDGSRRGEQRDEESGVRTRA